VKNRIHNLTIPCAGKTIGQLVREGIIEPAPAGIKPTHRLVPAIDIAPAHIEKIEEEKK
jgi:hypothetical protein